MSASGLILFSAIFMWISSIPVTGNMEEKLVKDLLKSYSKHARPVRNSSDTVNMIYDLAYIVIDLNEVENSQTLIADEYLFWHDENLVWDPTLYGEVYDIRLDSNSIWTPVLTSYYTINEVDAVRGQGTVVVYYTGQVLFFRIMKTKVRCKFDVHYFPFDSAYCSLIIQPWCTSSVYLNFTLLNGTVDLVNYENNPRWNLVKATVERRARKYSRCPESYHSIVYKNEFVRISDDYLLALLVPSFILSILTILLFMLPNQSSEKITMGILLFCVFSVILLYTHSVLPTADTTYYFVVFLVFNIIMLSLITLLNVLVVNLSNCESCRDVPKVVKSIVLEFMAKWFCMTSIVNRNRSRQDGIGAEINNLYRLSVSSDKQPLDLSAEDQSNEELMTANPSLDSNVAFIKALIVTYWEKAKEEEVEKRFRQEWKDVGQVMNRFFCVLYIPIVLIAVGVNLIQISSK